MKRELVTVFFILLPISLLAAWLMSGPGSADFRVVIAVGVAAALAWALTEGRNIVG